jgi:hypothetical protein
MVGKVKQKAINFSADEVKEGDGKTQTYLDISSIKKPKDIKNIYNQYCQILVDEQTQLKFVDFFETKNWMVEPMCEQFKKWEQHGVSSSRNGNSMGKRLMLSRWRKKTYCSKKGPRAMIGSLASCLRKQPRTLPNKTGWQKLVLPWWQTRHVPWLTRMCPTR